MDELRYAIEEAEERMEELEEVLEYESSEELQEELDMLMIRLDGMKEEYEGLKDYEGLNDMQYCGVNRHDFI